MGLVEVGKFLVDGDAVKAIVEDAGSSLRASLDDLYGPPKPPATLWWTTSTGISCLTTEFFTVSYGGVTCTAIAGWTDGAAFGVVDGAICGLSPARYVPTGIRYIGSAPASVSGLPGGVINGVAANATGGELFAWVGDKIYVGTPDITPGTNPDDEGTWDAVSITFSEFADAPLDPGSDSVPMAYGVDGSSLPCVYGVTPDGDVWSINDTDPPNKALDHTDSHTTSVQADPIIDDTFGIPLIYLSTAVYGVFGLFNYQTITPTPRTFTVYDGVGYVALDDSIVRYKPGAAAATMAVDVVVELMAISAT